MCSLWMSSFPYPNPSSITILAIETNPVYLRVLSQHQYARRIMQRLLRVRNGRWEGMWLVQRLWQGELAGRLIPRTRSYQSSSDVFVHCSTPHIMRRRNAARVGNLVKETKRRSNQQDPKRERSGTWGRELEGGSEGVLLVLGRLPAIDIANTLIYSDRFLCDSVRLHWHSLILRDLCFQFPQYTCLLIEKYIQSVRTVALKSCTSFNPTSLVQSCDYGPWSYSSLWFDMYMYATKRITQSLRW